MRLLNVNTRNLKEFVDDQTLPSYAILSHTWGHNEVVFDDIKTQGYQGGSRKIDGIINVAKNAGFHWIWIDTCCIDKGSSAELSEAINSMFAWYARSAMCYVWLEDVLLDDLFVLAASSFRSSRWFTRGWTLQELLAPNHLAFYDGSWNSIHRIDKRKRRTSRAVLITTQASFKPRISDDAFLRLLADITGIDPKVLSDAYELNARKYSVAQKMSWAAHRRTTRREDRAYSLMGLFDVNMPMLYGEGDKAFVRLQEEILKSIDDQTIFAWGYRQAPAVEGEVLGPGRREPPIINEGRLFASTPSFFSECQDVCNQRTEQTPHYFMTNKGLHVETYLTRPRPNLGSSYFALLTCKDSTYAMEDDTRYLAIPLYRLGDSFYRAPGAVPQLLPRSVFETDPVSVYISSMGTLEDYDWGLEHIWLVHSPINIRMGISAMDIWCCEVYPPHWSSVSIRFRETSLERMQVSEYSRGMVEMVAGGGEEPATQQKPRTDIVWIRFRAFDDVADLVLKLNVEWYRGAKAKGEKKWVSQATAIKHGISTIPKTASMVENIYIGNDDEWFSDLVWNDTILQSTLLWGQGTDGRPEITIDPKWVILRDESNVSFREYR